MPCARGKDRSGVDVAHTTTTRRRVRRTSEGLGCGEDRTGARGAYGAGGADGGGGEQDDGGDGARGDAGGGGGPSAALVCVGDTTMTIPMSTITGGTGGIGGPSNGNAGANGVSTKFIGCSFF